MSKRTKEPSQRQLKAGEVIRRALVDILAREEFRDPTLQGISITISEVQASPDLRHALIYAAPLGGARDGVDTAEVVKALNRSSKFLRGCLGREVTMRSTPTLRFELDTVFESATAMQELMSRPEITRDTRGINNEEE